MLIIISIAITILFWVILDTTIEKEKDGIILIYIFIFGISILVSVVGAINLFADWFMKDSNESKLEYLYNQSVVLIEAQESFQYKQDFDKDTFNEMVYKTVESYNEHLEYCKSENNSVLIGEFVNYDFCEKYKPIIIKNNRDFYLTS